MEEFLVVHRLPEWAPRLPKARVRRLYELDAHGIHDDELLDMVCAHAASVL